MGKMVSSGAVIPEKWLTIFTHDLNVFWRMRRDIGRGGWCGKRRADGRPTDKRSD